MKGWENMINVIFVYIHIEIYVYKTYVWKGHNETNIKLCNKGLKRVDGGKGI
jgi:hypothetical protein